MVAELFRLRPLQSRIVEKMPRRCSPLFLNSSNSSITLLAVFAVRVQQTVVPSIWRPVFLDGATGSGDPFVSDGRGTDAENIFTSQPNLTDP